MEITYLEIISQVFRERNQANPLYSLRSFARDLGISASTLSEILNKKKGISIKRAVELAKRLRLPQWQEELFCDLVTRDHAKSPLVRQEAELRLKDRKHENTMRLLNQTAQKALTSWVDLAILELTNLKDFRPTPEWIAKKLNTDPELVQTSVTRLIESKLLVVDEATGQWKDASPLFSTTDGVPNESIRNFHKTVLQLAQKKLENTDVDSRTVKSVVFSLSDENIPRAKKILDHAIGKIVALADESSQNRENVMCFSGQLFSLIESGDRL